MGAEATATGKSERIEPAARESTWAVVGGGAQLPIALVLAELQSRLYPYERRTQPPAIRMCTHERMRGQAHMRLESESEPLHAVYGR